jgi:hypothetical protein
VTLEDAVRAGAREGIAEALDAREARLVDAVVAKLVQALEPRLMPCLISLREYATIVGASVATAKRDAREGRIATVKIGRRVLVDMARLRGVDAADVARMSATARAAR